MFLFVWVMLAVIGALIGRRKRRALAGFIYSLILGPFGWLVIGRVAQTLIFNVCAQRS